LYGSAQYIASLRGTPERYDIVAPQGAFEWIGEQVSRIFNQGDTLDISASFDEALHDDYPPYVTITDNIISTTAEMNKVSDTEYIHSHALTNELGDVTLSFSNARDLFANEIISEPTDGGSITVVAPDTEPPVITLTPPLIVTLEAPTEYSEPGYSATDIVDGDITSNVIVTGTVDHNILGTYTLNYDISDLAGNPALQQTRIVIVQDTTKPDFGEITDITKEATDILTPVVLLIPTVTDTFEGILIPTVDNSGPFSLGGTEITWSVSDTSSNTQTAIQTITITDTTPPVITSPKPITIEATAILTPVTILNPLTTDIFPVTITNDAPTVFPLGTTIVTFTATDVNGNISTATQSITLQDTTIPVILLVGNSTQTIELEDTYTELGAAASDNIDGDITDDIIIDSSSLDLNTIGTYFVTYDVTDSSNNQATQLIRIVNVITPEFPKYVSYRNGTDTGFGVDNDGALFYTVDGDNTWNEPYAVMKDNFQNTDMIILRDEFFPREMSVWLQPNNLDSHIVYAIFEITSLIAALINIVINVMSLNMV